MASNYGATECFSGECGLCLNCTNNTENSFIKREYKQSESLRRARDFYKLMGKERFSEAKDRYDKNLMKWCKQYDYKDPYCYGYAPETIKLDIYSQNKQFKIIEKKHNNLCVHPYCKMIFFGSNEWEHKKRYPLIPMYTNNIITICGPCIMNKSFIS